MVLGSHCLSKAAWGKLVPATSTSASASTIASASRLHIRSYELSVLLLPSMEEVSSAPGRSTCHALVKCTGIQPSPHCPSHTPRERMSWRVPLLEGYYNHVACSATGGTATAASPAPRALHTRPLRLLHAALSGSGHRVPRCPQRMQVGAHASLAV